MSTETQEPKMPQFMVNASKWLPIIAKNYVAFGWLLGIAGVDVPKEMDAVLRRIASGESVTASDMKALKTLETREVGDPVFTDMLAEQAWGLHHKQGMGTRAIAELFTKQGSPCSHSTVARWINLIDIQKNASKMGKIIMILKWGGIAGAWIASIILVKLFL